MSWCNKAAFKRYHYPKKPMKGSDAIAAGHLSLFGAKHWRWHQQSDVKNYQHQCVNNHVIHCNNLMQWPHLPHFFMHSGSQVSSIVYHLYNFLWHIFDLLEPTPPCHQVDPSTSRHKTNHRHLGKNQPPQRKKKTFPPQNKITKLLGWVNWY